MTKPFMGQDVIAFGAYTSNKTLYEKGICLQMHMQSKVMYTFWQVYLSISSTSAMINEHFSHSKIRMNV